MPKGRVREESKGPTNSAHKYCYLLDAAGRPTQITDPVNKTTNINYTGTTLTMVDPENHTTTFAYNDLPGSPTTVTDALNHAAVYTYDAVGRLRTVVFNGTRTHSYDYDGVDNVLSESHPETGTMTYVYSNENRLYQKTWGGSTETYTYNTSGQLTNDWGAEQVTYTYDDKGRVHLVSGSTGWSRHRDYNVWGSVTSEGHTIPGLGYKEVSYSYDGNNILNQVTYPDGKVAAVTNNGLNRPESLIFNSKTLVSDASYGPNMQLTSATVAGNGTSLSATYFNNGALNTASLKKGATSLYNATYAYDGAGNITGISSTAPTPNLSATFGYDALNRLTSASYTSGRIASFTYDYDEYGNMRTVRENGAAVFDKTYTTSNQINGYTYDPRGNLTSANGTNYFWDAQNRLIYFSDISGQILGDYRYDDRGLRFSALPPVSDIEVDGIPTGGNIDMTSSLNTSSYKTLTIRNFGHASLTIEQPTISGQHAGQFSVHQQPGSPVAPGNSTTMIVEFLPTSSGDKNATLSIPSNDPDENPYTITLSGYCEPVMAVLEVTQGGSYGFGTVYRGDYVEAAFTVKDSGSGTLLLYGAPVVISGSGMSNFSITQQAASSLPPNGTSTFRIIFSPNSQGFKTATVTIQNNDPDRSPYSFTITGTGDIGPQKITDEGELSLTSPLGGEKWTSGSIHDITWSGGKSAQAVKIEYSPDNGSTFLPIAERAANIGFYPWQVPADLSPACLVRISDADGALAAPLIISYEFNFKVRDIQPSPGGTPDQRPAHFVFNAGFPDKTAQVYRVADVSFVPGEVKGSENLLFNQALVEIPASDAFLDAWHHVRIQYDIRNFSGSVWIDSLPVIADAPLQAADLKPESTSQMSLRDGEGVSVNLWIDDVEVRFLDQSDAGQETDDGSFRRIFKDSFGGYDSPELLAKGGWAGPADRTDSAAKGLSTGQTIQRSPLSSRKTSSEAPAARSRVLIDQAQFTSAPKAARLEHQTEDPSPLLAKQISFPVRLPFAISADSFSIVSVGGNGARVGNRLSKRELAQQAASGKENPTQSGSLALQRRGIEGRAGAGTSAGTAPEPRQPSSGGTVKKMSVSPAGGSYYIYSFDGRTLAEYNLLGVCVRDYIYMGTQLIAEFRPSTSQYYYYANDQINSTRVVTNDSGAVVYSAAFDPYGGVQKTWVNTFDPALKFAGKERDGESGLDYFGARYYDKAQYRFISTDPIINSASAVVTSQVWNLYSYCLNNPITFLDPDGMQTNIYICRTNYGPSSTPGVLYVGNVKIGSTWELPWRNNDENISCIPEGVYNAVIRWRDDIG